MLSWCAEHPSRRDWRKFDSYVSNTREHEHLWRGGDARYHILLWARWRCSPYLGQSLLRAALQGCETSHPDKDCPSIVDSRTDNSVIVFPVWTFVTLKFTSETMVSLFVADGQAKVQVNLLLKFQVYFNNSVSWWNNQVYIELLCDECVCGCIFVAAEE